MKSLLMLTLSILVAGCSLAPLTTTKTGRSLGDGNWQINTGLTPYPTFTVARGVGEKVDVGLILEHQIYPEAALFGKYSFINNGLEGWSLAGYGGAFSALDITKSYGAFAGPVMSFRHHWFEPYLTTRYNWVRWQGGHISRSNAEKDNSMLADEFYWSNVSIQYLQNSLGVNFWFSNHFGLNIYAQNIIGIGHHLKGKSIIWPGAELMFSF